MRTATAKFLTLLSARFEQLEDPCLFTEYAHDPIGFLQDICGVGLLTTKQTEVCEHVRVRRVTNVRAGHSVGKSFLVARLALWFALCRKGRVITSAPNHSQVEDIIWGEIRELLMGNPNFRGLHWGRTFFRVPGQPIEARGITARDRDKNSIQGRHGERLMIILDEACGITSEIDEGCRSCTTGEENRLIRIGNPVETGNPFEAACQIESIKIDSWSHPNISWAYEFSESAGTHILKPGIAEQIGLNPATGEALPTSAWPEALPRYPIPGAVTIGWIEEKRVNPLEGPGSPSWTARVEGEFPDTSENAIITKFLWDSARQRYDDDPEYWDQIADSQDWKLGIDVADGGTDKSVISVWRGPVLYMILQAPRDQDPYQDQNLLAGYIHKLLREYNGRVQIDGIGVGSPLAGRLRSEGVYDAFKIIWSNTDIADPKTFLNQKAEDFFELKRKMTLREIAIAPLGRWEAETKKELTDIRAIYDRNGKYRVEEKEKYRKRHSGASSDFADAVVLGFTDNLKESPSAALQVALPYLID